MGDPKKSRHKWLTPGHPWIKDRLQHELELIGKYGLRNKREVWIAESIVRNFRLRARSLLALPEQERSIAAKNLLDTLYRMGLVGKDAVLDDVLGLTAENVLERRLQTLVYRKGLARTIYQARQLVTHGHIAINGRRVTSPGYIVPRDEEDRIEIAPGSPLRASAQQSGGEQNVAQGA
ncbi:30S ribosomal protein S4 [Acidilobus sp.]|uniref:30S ribosomal protein S4 n=1 Tax=Acidilobus sp. TaxID=1872109 RepID=UPI003D040889